MVLVFPYGNKIGTKLCEKFLDRSKYRVTSLSCGITEEAVILTRGTDSKILNFILILHICDGGTETENELNL